MGNVSNKFLHFEQLTPEQIEKRAMEFEKLNPKELSEEQLEEVVALMAVHRRKTAGPAKAKTAKEPAKKVTFGDFLNSIQGQPQ
jgi:membrane protein involved in colicin uptake